MLMMAMMIERFRAFLREEKGLTAIEYGVFAAFVVLALVAAAIIVGPQLRDWIIRTINCIIGGTQC